MATEPEENPESSGEKRKQLLRLIWERDYEENQDIYDELARE